MKLSEVIIKRKKTFVRKKINHHDREVMEDVRTVLPSNTCKVLWEWEIKFKLFLIILPTYRMLPVNGSTLRILSRSVES